MPKERADIATRNEGSTGVRTEWRETSKSARITFFVHSRLKYLKIPDFGYKICHRFL